MKTTPALIFSIVLLPFVGTAWAAPQTVLLDVPGMTCALCPLTIKTALQRVEGVTKVDVSYERREAAVTYDDARTAPAALTEATRDAGYPSTVKASR